MKSTAVFGKAWSHGAAIFDASLSKSKLNKKACRSSGLPPTFVGSVVKDLRQ